VTAVALKPATGGTRRPDVAATVAALIDDVRVRGDDSTPPILDLSPRFARDGRQ
jgi:hypothetical protein